MQYTRVMPGAVQKFQMNAAIMVDSFDPDTGLFGNILGVTSGGITFNSNTTFEDFGADIDNADPGTWQFQRITSHDPTISGTFKSIDAKMAKRLMGAGIIEENGRIVPTHTLKQSDFEDFWVVGDYSASNDGAGMAGYHVVHISHGLNKTGYQWKTNDKGKGDFAFEIHGHYDADLPGVPPYEVYIKAGTSQEEQPGIRLNERVIRVPAAAVEAATLIAYTTPADATVSWASSNGNITIDEGTIDTQAANAGDTAIITASITDSDNVKYSDTCTVIVTD